MASPTLDVPVIDLGARADAVPSPEVVAQIANAAEHFGFFQIVNHGIPEQHLHDVWCATRSFFAQDTDAKRSINRTKQNSRGYYDRELTKNKRDLKEVLDIAQVPFPELGEDHPDNAHPVDGRNQWPQLDGFQTTVMRHLADCSDLSLWLLSAFTLGLGEEAEHLRHWFAPRNTSFLRMNHYPVGDLLDADEAVEATPLGDMALHHHSDSGALTLLLQDDVGGLQVKVEDSWVGVTPTEEAIVVNTGDMMQVWSNDRYQAALHRVLPRSQHNRFSLPYFFNPSYDTNYAPLPGSIREGEAAHYRSINWGDFRQARADGDFADYGTEVQISQFRIG